MSEPSLMVAGRRRGRPPLFGTPLTKSVEILFTDEQAADLKSIAKVEGRDVTAIVRDAVNEYVGDFRERRVFVAPANYRPE